MSGDGLFTPGWCWHGLVNEGDRAAYWLDVLDVPLIDSLGLRQFEPHPRGFEDVPAVDDSPMRLRWCDLERRLDQAGGGAARSVELDIGHPALPTFALSMLHLPPRGELALSGSLANQLFAVVRGSGTMVIGGQTFGWERGDVVAVPAGHEHVLHAQDSVVLFRVS